MFFARGASYIISIDTISIKDPLFTAISGFRIPIGSGVSISINVVVSLILAVVAIFVLKYTRFYTVSGFWYSLAGLLFTIYTLLGYGLNCLGTGMDAIAACVIGWILLAGRSGYPIGPVFGVLTMGIIQSLIMFQGNLNSWWTKTAIGMLLFIFGRLFLYYMKIVYMKIVYMKVSIFLRKV